MRQLTRDKWPLVPVECTRGLSDAATMCCLVSGRRPSTETTPDGASMRSSKRPLLWIRLEGRDCAGDKDDSAANPLMLGEGLEINSPLESKKGGPESV